MLNITILSQKVYDYVLGLTLAIEIGMLPTTALCRLASD